MHVIRASRLCTMVICQVLHLPAHAPRLGAHHITTTCACIGTRELTTVIMNNRLINILITNRLNRTRKVLVPPHQRYRWRVTCRRLVMCRRSLADAPKVGVVMRSGLQPPAEEPLLHLRAVDHPPRRSFPSHIPTFCGLPCSRPAGARRQRTSDGRQAGSEENARSSSRALRPP